MQSRKQLERLKNMTYIFTSMKIKEVLQRKRRDAEMYFAAFQLISISHVTVVF